MNDATSMGLVPVIMEGSEGEGAFYLPGDTAYRYVDRDDADTFRIDTIDRTRGNDGWIYIHGQRARVETWEQEGQRLREELDAFKAYTAELDIPTSLGARMKGYEMAARLTLPRRMPLIVRVDGKAFHRWTRGLARPFDDRFIRAMNDAALLLCQEIQGAEMAYVQSDEISVLVHNYKRLDTAAWFDNQVQKIVSVAASMASASLTLASMGMFSHSRRAYFDGRAFVLPESEVCNAFIWRQQDAARNSVQMLAQSLFSQTELHGKNCDVMQEMIYQRSGQNWGDLSIGKRRGRCIRKSEGVWLVDAEPPLFHLDRVYVERCLAVDPEPPKPVSRFGEQ